MARARWRGGAQCEAGLVAIESVVAPHEYECEQCSATERRCVARPNLCALALFSEEGPEVESAHVTTGCTST